MIMRIFPSLFLCAIALGLLISCNPKPKAAVVVVLGRYAYANDFNPDQIATIERLLANSAGNGYVRMILGGENPKRVSVPDYDQTKEFVHPDSKLIMPRKPPSTLGYYDDSSYKSRHRPVHVSENIRLIKNYFETSIVHAGQPKNDLFASLLEAVSVLDSIALDASENGWKVDEKHIVFMDSGIVTSGAMDFSKFNFAAVDFYDTEKTKEQAAVVFGYLHDASKSSIPNLEGIKITFIGLGDVADPQKLSQEQAVGLEAFWKAFFVKCGAISEDIRFSNTGIGSGKPKIIKEEIKNPIKLGGSPPLPKLEIVFRDRETNFQYPERAAVQLEHFAGQLKQHFKEFPKSHVVILGSESGHNYSGSLKLSKQRAEKVMEELRVQHHISSNNMKAEGLGIKHRWWKIEEKDGKLNDDIAKSNRKVLFMYSNELDKMDLLNDELARINSAKR